MEDDQRRLKNGLKEGNKEIFEEIYRAYYSPLCFYCLRYVGDLDEAKEIVQGLFLKIWIKRKELKITSTVKLYLYGAVQNYALNYLQQQKTKKKYVNRKLNLPVAHTENGQLRMEEEELKKLIKSAILKLPDKRREIFELSRFENLKYSQIADQMRISVKTVESQMSKSLIYLRKVLKEYMPIIVLQLLWLYNDFYW